jgi:hypothetical protein
VSAAWLAALVIQAGVLVDEKFEDIQFAARGWYDGSAGTLSTAEHLAGSNSSLECRFKAGSTGCEGGTPRRHLFADTESVYLSFHIKHSANWGGSGQSYGMHQFYFLTNQSTAYNNLAYTNLTLYMEEGNGKPTVACQDGANIDETKINQNLINVTENRAVAGCNGTLTDGHDTLSCYLPGAASPHWNGKQWLAKSVYFSDTAGAYDKSAWHFVEAYFKLNSISNGKSVADGVVQYWFDGTLIMDHQAVILRTAKFPNMKLNQLMIAPYMGSGSPRDQAFWIDNLTVATSRPASTSATPAAPTNLRFQ